MKSVASYLLILQYLNGSQWLWTKNFNIYLPAVLFQVNMIIGSHDY